MRSRRLRPRRRRPERINATGGHSPVRRWLVDTQVFANRFKLHCNLAVGPEEPRMTRMNADTTEWEMIFGWLPVVHGSVGQGSAICPSPIRVMSVING